LIPANSAISYVVNLILCYWPIADIAILYAHGCGVWLFSILVIRAWHAAHASSNVSIFSSGSDEHRFLKASILWGNGWHARGLTTQKDK